MGRRKKSSDTARARLPLNPSYDHVGIVTTCKRQCEVMQGCDDYAKTPAIQTAVTTLLASSGSLEETLSDLAAARLRVSLLEGQRDTQVVVVQRDHDALEVAVDTTCQGDAAAIRKWGADVAGRRPSVPSKEMPVGTMAASTGKLGEVAAWCKADKRAYVYLFQYNTAPTDPETWPAPVFSSGAKLKVGDLAPGQKMYFRIAIVRRKSGQGAWSDMVEAVAR